MIHVYVGQEGSFRWALAYATGYLEPRAKLVFGAHSTACVRIQAWKKFDGLLWDASFAKGTPKFAPRNAIKAVFESNVDRVQVSFHTSARLDEALCNDSAKHAAPEGSKPVLVLKA